MRAGLFDGAEIGISFVNSEDPDGHGEIGYGPARWGDPSAAFEGHARCLTLPAGYFGHGSGAIWDTSPWFWTSPAVFARNKKLGDPSWTI